MQNLEILRKYICDEFSSDITQQQYIKEAEKGLWDSEKIYIEKYFEKFSTVLDLGCGTGRTTIPLFQAGFNIHGVDISIPMIKNAKTISKEKKLNINYVIGDAINLHYKNNQFDNVLFSNQGITHIPTVELRKQTLNEIYRVLKKDGIFIFSTHQRIINLDNFVFWFKEYIKTRINNILNHSSQKEFGDIFFERKILLEESNKILKNKQFIHIPNIDDIKNLLIKSGFIIIDIDTESQISKNDIRKHPPVIYVCQK